MGNTGKGRFPSQIKASDAELWCFLLFVPEHTAKQTIEAPVIWRHCNDNHNHRRLSWSVWKAIRDSKADASALLIVSR